MKQTELEKTELTIGYVPLSDCATLIVASEKGFFKKHGLDVTLSREASWANIRDKVAYGVIDAALMLATMPVASTLGIGGWKKEMVSSFVLSANGNAITISSGLYEALKNIEADFDQARPVTANSLKTLIEMRKAAGEPMLNFAHVFPTSTHNYLLRYWLASAGIDPDHDVKLSVIPPMQMVENLEAGIIDGFCVGEPWNQYAVTRGNARVLISSYEIWNNAPDKVLGMTKEWAYNHPNTHKALIKSLVEAAQWADDVTNREQVAELLAGERFIDIPIDVIRPSLTGHYPYSSESAAVEAPDFHLFYRYAATFPWYSHMAWYISQMMRWHDMPATMDVKSIIKDIYWVDFYRQVFDEMGLDYPLLNQKPEGVHAKNWEIESKQGQLALSADLFFDGQHFEIS